MKGNSANGSAGVIFAYFSSVTIKISKFTNNTAKTGGVFHAESSNMSSTLNTYIHNTAVAKGGVMYFIQSSILETGSNLSENVAFYAGIIFAQDTSISFARCIMKLNKAIGWFGGVVCIQRGSIDFIESKLSDNSAEVSGGVAEVTAANVNIHICNFLNNSVKNYYGGVLHAVQANIDIRKSNLTNSIASKNGGAIMIDNSYMTISDSKFINNAGSHGGAIDFYHDQGNEIVTIVNTKFENNSATFNGGAVHGDSQTVFY